MGYPKSSITVSTAEIKRCQGMKKAASPGGAGPKERKEKKFHKTHGESDRLSFFNAAEDWEFILRKQKHLKKVQGGKKPEKY